MIRKILTISIIIFVILFVVFLFFLPSILSGLRTGRTPNGAPPSITPFILSTSPVPNAPESTLLIPTNPPDAGGGVNTSAPSVELSTAEIKKVNPFLPYSQQTQLSTGLTVDIIISDMNMNTRPWVLPIFIGGINYGTPADSPEYALMRGSFREAAAIALDWITKQGANPAVMFVSWGDRAYIQDRAEEWLR